MTMHYLIVLFGFTTATQAVAQTTVMVTHAPYTSNGLYQRDPGNALQAAANPALIANYQQFTATAYGEKRFMLDDLSLVQMGFVLPVQSGGFALQASSFGSSAYSQSRVGLAYGRRLTEHWGIGVQFNYQQYHISGYGRAGTVSASAGMLYRFSPTLTAGVHAEMMGNGMGVWKSKKAPHVFSAGLGYAPSSSFYIDATLVKEAAQSIELQTSLQYVVQNKLLVKGGISTASAQYFFGGGYRIGALQLEAAATWHPHLGISPGLMVTYKKEKD